MVKLQSLLVEILLAIGAVATQIPADWAAPIEPFNVAGNIPAE